MPLGGLGHNLIDCGALCSAVLDTIISLSYYISVLFETPVTSQSFLFLYL